MRKLQGIVPVILSTGLVVAIVLLSIRKLSSWHGTSLAIGIALIASYLVWLAIEARVAVGEISKGQTAADRGTFGLYASGRAATVITALVVPQQPPAHVGTIAFGYVLFLSAVVFRLVAIRTLGQFYSHYVRVLGQHRIVDTGPYRVLRHPAYTGMLFAHLGFVLVFFNWLGLGVLLGVLLPAICWRIRIEERAMCSIPAYVEYGQSKKRLIPLVW